MLYPLYLYNYVQAKNWNKKINKKIKNLIKEPIECILIKKYA